MTWQRNALRSTVPGGRARARQAFVAAVWFMTAAVSTPAAPLSDADPAIRVREDGGLYRVSATFVVDQPAAVVRHVLTDYEQIPRFVPEVVKSRIVSKDGGRILVEQEAMARVFMFSARVFLLLDVSESSSEIRFRDTCGRSFSTYEGRWSIAERDGRVSVTYELTAKPTFSAPSFLIGRLLKRDAGRMIDGLRGQMQASHAAVGAAASPRVP